MAKKRRNFFDFLGLDDFEEIRRMFEGMEDDLNLDELKEGEPLVYGFNVRIGPDGKPLIQQFGNVKPGVGGPKISEDREPLVDVIEKVESIDVIAELPGAYKDKIKLNTTENTLTISTPSEERKFYKEVKLPSAVKPKSAKATFKNGVLEVTLEKKEKSKPHPESIKVD